jgi:hypothetical protein
MSADGFLLCGPLTTWMPPPGPAPPGPCGSAPPVPQAFLRRCRSRVAVAQLLRRNPVPAAPLRAGEPVPARVEVLSKVPLAHAARAFQRGRASSRRTSASGSAGYEPRGIPGDPPGKPPYLRFSQRHFSLPHFLRLPGLPWGILAGERAFPLPSREAEGEGRRGRSGRRAKKHKAGRRAGKRTMIKDSGRRPPFPKQKPPAVAALRWVRGCATRSPYSHYRPVPAMC